MKIHVNAIRESVQDRTVSIHHITGLLNIADIFTKDLRDAVSFTTIWNVITSLVPDLSFSSE